MSLYTPMLQPSADSTGYWLVWVSVMAGKWVKEGGFSGDAGRFGEDSVMIGVKKGRNGVSMVVDDMGIGVYSSYTLIGFPRQVLRSGAYKDLSTNARALMFELQDIWRPFEPDLHYSVRRAAVALGVANGTAGNAYKELIEHGFIRCVDGWDWFNGKARVWRLNWLANHGKEPTNEWMKWSKNKS